MRRRPAKNSWSIRSSSSVKPLADQRILVTGASSGLGRALAVKLASEGAQVIATARREDRLRDLADAHTGIEPRVLDLMNADAIAAFCASVGSLDGAVLNAGVTAVERFLDGADISDAAMVDTNIMANVRLARALAEPLNGGRLVLVGSLAGLVALPYQAVYSGTKAFIQNFGLALRAEWAGRVNVGVFAPGGIKTEMTEIEALSKLQGALADVDTVAGDLFRFYCSGKALRVPGASNRAAVMAAKFLPRPLLSQLMKRVYRP